MIFAITVGMLVWKIEESEQNLEMQTMEMGEIQQKQVSNAYPVQSQESINSKKDVSHNIEPEKTICDKKDNLIHWDESKNGYYHTRNSNYFTFSYPCNYEINFSDKGSFYYLKQAIDPDNKIYILRSLYDNARINGVKKLYPNSHSEILDKKINTKYPYKIYNIKIDSNEQVCGECIENPGHEYNGIEIKVSDKLYYYFQSDSEIYKEELFNIAESFVYYVMN